MLHPLLVLLAPTLLAGCSALGYYGQAVKGHLGLVTAREPIDKVMTSDQVSAEVKARLAVVMDARRFASEALGLPDNNSYTYYTQLDRPYAVWNVVATPRDSLQPLKWCFPVAGCVSYRGYFERRDAERFAAELRKEGHDVAVLGATAYSTLGWFADPVLSTMLAYPDPELAGTIFHELAHQRLYVKGDTAFNEAFATVVEEQGVRRWLETRGAESELSDWKQRRQRQQAFTDLLLDLREGLATLYERAEQMHRETLLEEKRALFDVMRQRYRALSRSWPNNPYKSWMKQELNNAHLALVSAYRGGVPAFERLLECVGGDLEVFYRAAERVAAWPPEQRRRWLEAGDEAGIAACGDFPATCVQRRQHLTTRGEWSGLCRPTKSCNGLFVVMKGG